MGITLITNSSPFSEIGSKTLSSYLNKFGVSANVIYLNNILSSKLSETEKKQILNIVEKDELIGISLMTKDLYLFKDLSDYLKGKSKIPIVWGGIHPSVCPEESLACCDYVCIGEGEKPLLMLYKTLNDKSNLGKIPNIAYKKRGKIIYPKCFFAVKDINNLPFPDYEFNNDYLLVGGNFLRINILNEKEKKASLGETLLFYSQRGCPFSCSYCSNNALKQISQKASVNFYRKTTIKRAIMELSYYTSKYKFINKIIINDDDFLARSENEIKIFSRKYSKIIKRPFWINAVPGFVTASKIKDLCKAGLTQISMGIQTGSKHILREVYKRYLYPEQIVKSVNIINKCNKKLKICFDLIVDNPYETEADVIQTIKLLNNIPKPYDLQVHSLVFFPGTELYKEAVNDGLIIDKNKQIYFKKYQIDIGSSYLNFILMLNSLINLPKGLNNVLSSRFMRESVLLKPFRFILSKSVKVLILLKGIKSLFLNPQLAGHYLKHLKL